MTAKRKGTRNEHKTIRWLEARGYSCTRAAGSLGMFDVVAIPDMDGKTPGHSEAKTKCIQVKSNAWVYGKEKQAMLEFSYTHDVSVEMWRWDDYAREPKVRYL